MQVHVNTFMHLFKVWLQSYMQICFFSSGERSYFCKSREACKTFSTIEMDDTEKKRINS